MSNPNRAVYVTAEQSMPIQATTVQEENARGDLMFMNDLMFRRFSKGVLDKTGPQLAELLEIDKPDHALISRLSKRAAEKFGLDANALSKEMEETWSEYDEPTRQALKPIVASGILAVANAIPKPSAVVYQDVAALKEQSLASLDPERFERTTGIRDPQKTEALIGLVAEGMVDQVTEQGKVSLHLKGSNYIFQADW